jgi:hypothetical protein
LPTDIIAVLVPEICRRAMQLTAPADDVQRSGSLMISAVARDHPQWLWQGVGAAR